MRVLGLGEGFIMEVGFEMDFERWGVKFSGWWRGFYT